MPPIRFARARFSPLAATLALASILAACAGTPPPPDYPPLASVKRVAEESAPASVSLYRTAFRFEEDGTYLHTVHQTYKVLTPAGVEGWGTTEARWSPWRTDRPQVEVKVASPTGTVSALDPASLTDAAAFPEAPEMYEDEHVLRAPLPNVTVGAVVDENIVMHVRRPFLGNAEAFVANTQVGVARDRVEVVIDVPESMPLQYEARDAKLTVAESHAAGRRVITLTGGPYEAIQELEASAPSNVIAWPHVTFTTGKSWKPLASAYAHVVDQKIQNANFDAIVQKVVLRSDSPIAKADKLLAWMRDRVRYVGIELSDSTVIPRTPAETLGHGYGDCKDQAVVMVALLRAAGLSPRVALLDAGFGQDIDARMPALNVFDHAIVVVPGPTPLWIDPTSTRARAGELPTPDQGRYALVADDETTALTRTPGPSEQLNTYRELREIFLADEGGARIVETSSATGSIERGLRTSFDVGEAEVTKGLKDYVSKAYSSKNLGHVDMSKVDDLAHPFTLKVEATDAGVAVGELLTASVSLPAAVVFGWVPDALREGKERQADFALATPYRAELVFEIHPRDGFTMEKKPEVSDVVMGPATLRRSVEERADGVIVATYRFELPKAVWSARDVNEFRKAYDAFGATTVPLLSLVHPAQKLHTARQVEKELATYRHEAELHPNSAASKMRLAKALVDLGFGMTARKLATEAIKLAPEDGMLWGYVGYVRTHDTLGRWEKPGWDFAGAIDAYREALRLEPSSMFMATHLSGLLEFNETAHRYAPGSRLDEARATLDAMDPAAVAAYENGGFVGNAIFDLLRLGRYEEARARLAKLGPTSKLWVPAIVAEGMLGGTTAALSEATRLSLPVESRTTTLEAAADILVELRRYPEAAALVSAAAEGSSNERLRHRAEGLAKTRRLDVATMPVGRPEDVVRKVLALCMAHPATLKDDLRPLVSTRAADAAGSSAFASVCKDLASVDPFDGRAPGEAVADIVLAQTQLATDGSDALGYRVRANADGSRYAIYLVHEAGAYQVRAPSDAPVELGCEALALEQAGHRAAAVQWLTWARELVTPAGGDDPLSMAPFDRFWTEKHDDVLVSAASLCAGRRHADAAVIPVLTAARATASGERKLWLDQALTAPLASLDRDAELLATTTELVREVPSSRAAWTLKRRALEKMGLFQAVRDEAAARAAKMPDDPDRLEELARAEARLGHFAEAYAVGSREIAGARALAATYNEQAWRSLFKGTVTEDDLGYALRAVNAEPSDAGVLNTLAAVDIALGHTEDARERLVRTVELRKGKEPADSDFYVLGRIAEQLGLPDEAKAAYARIAKAPKSAGLYSTAHLAEVRLRALR